MLEASRGSSVAIDSARSREGLAGKGGRQELVWPDNVHKPASADGHLAALNLHVGRAPADSGLHRSAGYGRWLTTENVSQLCDRGLLTEAVETLGALVQANRRLSQSLLYAILKECVVQKNVILGRRVHALIVKGGYASDTFLCNHILRMYVSHARLQEAIDVFTHVAMPDAFIWSSIISAHVKHGLDKEAIQLYHQMCRSNVKPDGHVFVAALQACARGADLKNGQQVHADLLASGVEPDLFVFSCLVDMYAKCSNLEDAQRVFDGLGEKDAVLWNAMIAGYAQQGMRHEALRLYSAMQGEGIARPTSVTFVCLLQACANVGTTSLEQGKHLHAQIREQGLEADLPVANSLVSMYAKCGSLEDAHGLFDRIRHKDLVTWNALIAGYSQKGMVENAFGLYWAMQEEGIVAPDSVTFVCVLQACAGVGAPALERGKQLHAQIRERRLQDDEFVASSLVNMYAKCGRLDDAEDVFNALVQKTLVTWNAMICGYSQHGMGERALHLYSALQEGCTAAPDSVTFVSLLQACASVGSSALKKGREIHAQIQQQNLTIDSVLGCSLVNMYAKCGSLEVAQSVFNGLPQKDLVMWNSMIAGYSQMGMGQEAIQLYSTMRNEGIVAPGSVTFVSLLQACANVGTLALEMGKELHAEIEDAGLQADVVVANSLVNMYAKCGSLEDAQRVFDRLPWKDVVTWTALIAGYVQEDMGQEALCVYKAMQEEGMAAPDSVTYVCLLQACASVAAVHVGRKLHADVEQEGRQADLTLANSLIIMYAKSGSMVDAQQLFDALPTRNAVTWNALIAGYTSQGDSQEVFELVQRMQEDGIQPDGITFLSVLQVCSHCGIVQKGREYFESMIKHYCLTPAVEHYTCMVDLLARANHLDEALALIATMPILPSASVWHTLLCACQKWSNVAVGRHAFDKAVQLNENDAAAYVLMSNIYTGAKMWEQAQGMQARRARVRARKQPGQSWWTDMEGRVISFVVGDNNRFEMVEECVQV